ncbi:MAG: RNA polymerase sigma factor [Chitinophagaceae bacterium]
MTDQKYYDEAALLLRMAESDQAALGAIMDHYTQVIYPYLLYWVKNAELAQEISQDVFISVWRNRHRLRDVSNFSGYIYTIARNKAISAINAELSRMQNEVKEQAPEITATSAPQVELKELSSVIDAAVATLPPKRKEVFLLSREEELTYEEIAEKLSISRNTVKGHIVAALVHLRDYLKTHSDIVWVVMLLW